MAATLTIAQKQLLEVVKSYLSEKNVDCFLALDGSSSISSKDFALMKTACTRILGFGDDNIKFGALQFSHLVELISQLDWNRMRVARALSATRQLRMTTATDLAFVAVRNYFRTSPRYNKANRVLILLTDGHPNDPVTAHVHALSLLAESVRIIVVAIGDTKKESVHNLSSPGCSFFLDNFRQLNETFKGAGGMPVILRDYEVGVEYEPIKSPIAFGDHLALLITITNNGAMCIPEGTRFKFKETSQFYEAVLIVPLALPGQQYMTLTLDLTPKLPVSISTLTSLIPFEIYTPEAIQVHTEPSTIELYIHMLCGDAFRGRSRRNVLSEGYGGANILLFGKCGSGKMSYINTVINALSPSEELYLAKTPTPHTAGELTRWKLGRMCGLYDVEINLWDTWGMNDNMYTPQDFQAVLRGDFRGRYCLKDALDLDHFVELDETTIDPREKVMSAVCLFLTQSAARGNAEEMDRLAECARIAVENGRQPLVIVSQIDLEPDLTQRQELISRVSSAFGVPMEHIILVENYLEGFEKKEFNKDRIAYNVLLNCLSLSDQFQKRLTLEKGARNEMNRSLSP